MKKGYLVLQDGQVFEGVRFGADEAAVGELVFTTGMCGYIETLTDPSYAGQIVMQTYPLIGNYGIIREDFEGDCCVKGYVVREWCDAPSNFRTDCDLDTYLKEQGVPGLYGVDTRELTRIIREHGVMNAAICDEVPADLTPVATYAVTGVVEAVTLSDPVIDQTVREQLGLPDGMVYRQPFPGPGLGVRCLGAITRDRLNALREADAILREEFDKNGLAGKVWQYFIAVPDMKSVGVKDGKRYEGWPAIIRAVNTRDAMTATIEEVPYPLLHHITNRITTEVPGINRVLLDLTPKPTGTIEWE